MSGPTALMWQLREQLSPSTRRTIRALSDGALRPLGSIREVRTPESIFALSFDDGPDPVWTPPLLDLLDEHAAKATFFLLSDRVERNRRIVQEIVTRGHEIALHGDDHTRLTTLSTLEVSRRITRAKGVVEDIAGVSVRWFRPPFGAQSVPIYLALRRAGLQVVVWGPVAEDWIDGTPAEVASRAIPDLRPGCILLLHDGLAVPPGEIPPTFDRVAAFRLILEAAVGPTSVGDLVTRGRTMRTAWFRP